MNYLSLGITAHCTKSRAMQKCFKLPFDFVLAQPRGADCAGAKKSSLRGSDLHCSSSRRTGTSFALANARHAQPLCMACDSHDQLIELMIFGVLKIPHWGPNTPKILT
ncbi:hypothetical protein ACSFBI_33375 [Variovorax sp. RB3P1]|uniref:hypothetical protein n=1 Tax=Variovorax sp. RB3P1 TaxID=3443732 RepID=UPI003F46430E